MNLSDLKKELLKSTNFKKAYLKHDINYEVARMLIEARIIKGFTQEKLASSIGTTQSSIARAEQGGHAVSFDFLEKIANAYKTYIIPPRFAFMDSITAVEARNQLLTAKPPSATAYWNAMKMVPTEKKPQNTFNFSALQKSTALTVRSSAQQTLAYAQ